MTIYEWITNEIATGAFESNCRLPDHADLGEPGGESWVPGAYESLLMRSNYSIRRYAIQNYLLARKVRKQMLKPSEKHREAEEKALLKAGALAVVDPLISFLFAMRTDKAAMRAEARRLALGTGKRELVKVGIALLGVCGEVGDNGVAGDSDAAVGGEIGVSDAAGTAAADNALAPSDLDLILTLSRHEEFTFYGAPATRALVGAAKVNDVLLPLADLLDGWGKTAILYELNYDKALADADVSGVNPASDYLLRRGCKNRLGPALNANLCATKGRLSDTLEQLVAAAGEGATLPDQELFTGICEIMWGLTEFDGVHDSLNDYKYGITARGAFKDLLDARPELCELDSRAGTILERMR